MQRTDRHCLAVNLEIPPRHPRQEADAYDPRQRRDPVMHVGKNGVAQLVG